MTEINATAERPLYLTAVAELGNLATLDIRDQLSVAGRVVFDSANAASKIVDKATDFGQHGIQREYGSAGTYVATWKDKGGNKATASGLGGVIDTLSIDIPVQDVA